MTRTVKRRLLKAKMTLNQTIQNILEINHYRKKLPYFENANQRQQALKEELRVLNKIAEHQAKLIRHYEHTLSEMD